MHTGTKIVLSFLTGAIAGAAGLAYLNKNKMDFKYMKPLATKWMAKSMQMSDAMVSKMASMKEDWEDMAAEARDEADKMKTRDNADTAPAAAENK